MSNVKERILGAVTIMSEKDAEKVWNLIQSAFALSNAEEVVPDEEELAEALEEIIEYVRTIAMLFYTHFNDDAQEIKPILH